MPTSAYAYLDPGTGAFAVQSLIAAIAGGLIAVRAYGRRILGLFWLRCSGLRTMPGIAAIAFGVSFEIQPCSRCSTSPPETAVHLLSL